MRVQRLLLVMVLLVMVLVGTVVRAGEPIPFDSPRWEIEAQESRVEEYLGRPSLYLLGGTALIRDSAMLDGVIEFDIAIGPERGFAGATWRVQDLDNREELYLRAHQSGNPDANQYTPLFNGQSAWQLYHGEGYGVPVEYDFNTWMPIKIVVSGGQAEVYLRDLQAPALFIDELKREPQPGKVGLTVNRFAPAHFSNFRFTPSDSPPTLAARVERTRPARPGSIMSWQVSSPFAEELLDSLAMLPPEIMEPLSWSRLDCESTGLANLSRVHALQRSSNTVLVRAVLESDRDRSVGLAIGYSDRVRVYLNDQLLYTGDNGYRTRDYRYLGTIGYFDEVFLPLHEGTNELLLAVSESFGGWGVQAALAETDGLTIVQ